MKKRAETAQRVWRDGTSAAVWPGPAPGRLRPRRRRCAQVAPKGCSCFLARFPNRRRSGPVVWGRRAGSVGIHALAKSRIVKPAAPSRRDRRACRKPCFRVGPGPMPRSLGWRLDSRAMRLGRGARRRRSFLGDNRPRAGQAPLPPPKKKAAPRRVPPPQRARPSSLFLGKQKRGKKPNDGSFYVSENLFFYRTARQAGRIAASGAVDWEVGGDQEPKSGGADPMRGKDPPSLRPARIAGEGARGRSIGRLRSLGRASGRRSGANVASIAALSFPFAYFPLVIFSFSVSRVLTALTPVALAAVGQGGGFHRAFGRLVCPVLAQARRIAGFRIRIREPRIPSGVGRNRALNNGWADWAGAPSPRMARSWLRRGGARLGRVCSARCALVWSGLARVGLGGRLSWIASGLSAPAWPSRNGWVGL